jgi:hypothetical protein
MKLSAIVLIIALFMSAGARPTNAEEQPSPVFTALSSSTIRGYVYTGTHWRQHVCRPVRPIRAERVVAESANGVPRLVGHTVRCRHGSMFVPIASSARFYPTPNRSSAFGVSMRRAPRRPGRPGVQPPTPPIPTNRPPVIVITNIIVLPPRPPRTNWPPVVVMPPGDGGVIITRPPLRPPLTNLPPIIVISPPTNVPPVVVRPPSDLSGGSVTAVRSVLSEEHYRGYERRRARVPESPR